MTIIVLFNFKDFELLIGELIGHLCILIKVTDIYFTFIQHKTYDFVSFIPIINLKFIIITLFLMLMCLFFNLLFR